MHSYTCNDADGCELNLSESGCAFNQLTVLVNVGTNPITLLEVAGVANMPGTGNLVLGRADVVQLLYVTNSLGEFVVLSHTDS